MNQMNMDLIARTPARRRPRTAAPTGPVSGLMDRRFKYTSPLNTNVRATIRRIQAEQAKGLRA